MDTPQPDWEQSRNIIRSPEVRDRIEGTGANVDISFTPAGTGKMRFGSHSAIAAETVTGYITIKDSGGTDRKIAVVS